MEGVEQVPTPVEKKEDFTLNSPQVKKYLPWILLAIFLVLGFTLRAYHLGYPVVGYHNWKEEHYLSEARNYARNGFFANGFFVSQWDLPFLNEPADGAHSDTFQTTAILGAFVYQLFPDNLAALRSIGVLLNVASILLLYLIVKRLFKREDLALTTAALAALNPLMIFFSRNFQLDSPALFLCLLGTWFYLNWLEKDRAWEGVLAVFCMLLGIITKYTFIILAVPWFALFPWKNVFAKEWWTKSHLRFAIASAVLFVLSLTWLWYMEIYYKNLIKSLYHITGGGAVISFAEIIQFTVVFTADFWHTMTAFIADNFTLLGIAFAGVGLVLLALMWKKHREGSKYFLLYAGFGLAFFVILSYKLSGHSYHQYPYAPLIVFLIAYAFVVIGATIAGLVKVPHVKWVVITLLVLALWPATHAALNRQFDTQFIGLDVAGDFIRQNSEPWERVFHSSQQSYGVLWHADRKGYKLPSTAADLRAGEAANVTWLFIYQWRFDTFQNKDMMDYISTHYQLRQIGFVQQNNQFTPYYFLLQKGGTFDINKFNEQLTNQPVQTKTYELSGGLLNFNYINLPRNAAMPANVTTTKAPVTKAPVANTTPSTSG
ncbi:MAG TPA: glycosyltransferase family 39 protein [Candidatus Binatia bacterium]|nr:glycosyltransferase family 39 protein [Candidatus Binatia bacterium]